MHQRRRHSLDIGSGPLNQLDPGKGTQVGEGLVTGGIVNSDNLNLIEIRIFPQGTQTQFRQLRRFVIRQQNSKHILFLNS